MAIVLVIIGLLLGGLLMPLSAQLEQQRISETQKYLDQIREALLGLRRCQWARSPARPLPLPMALKARQAAASAPTLLMASCLPLP